MPTLPPNASPTVYHDILQAGLDLLDQGISVFDRELKLVAWNRPFLQLLEFPDHLAQVGTPFAEFLRYNVSRGEYGPGDPEAQIAERLAEARGFQPHQRERRRPNGKLILVRGEPLPNGGFVTLYSDITEQRYLEHLSEHQNLQLDERVRRRTAQLENANAKLRQANAEKEHIAAALGRSEARLRLINDTIPILIGYVDRNEIYQYANRGYSDWYGLPEGSVTGRAVIDVIGPYVYEQVVDFVRKALSGQQVSYEYQMFRQGEPVFARSTLVPEIGGDGQALGFFVFSYEVTEQKRMQAALIQAQKMEAIGQLTGGLAHDFNNLLTVIIGNLAALQDQRPNDPTISDFVSPALQSARRGAELIKRLLTFSRQQPLEPQAVDICKLITDLMRLIRRTLPDNIAVNHQFDGNLLYARVDPAQLESALLNFALNARDAMPEGGTLLITAAPLELNAEASRYELPPGDYIHILVRDTGCGMDAYTLAHACEPFFSTKRLGLGSGLGLAMASGFVRQSGGNMQLNSAPGRGTQIELLLPATTPPIASETEEDIETSAAGGELVLLVEDEPSVRQVVRQQLIDLGHLVIEAENADQALSMVQQIPDIAIVVSDILMPGTLNGQQLAARIQQEHPTMQIILMSGYNEVQTGSNSLPILAKPFVRQELAKALRDRTRPGASATEQEEHR